MYPKDMPPWIGQPPIPDGWEFVELNIPKPGDHVLSNIAHGDEIGVRLVDFSFDSAIHYIVRRIEE